MYVLIKPAGDDTIRIAYVDGQIGQRQDAAQKLAKEVNEAMVALREVRRLFGNNWQAELKRFEELVKEL